MPAHDFEVEEALQEGISIKWLSTIKEAGEAEIMVEKMALDENGFPQPTGEYERIEADSVVLALGQDADLSLLENVPGLVVNKGMIQVNAGMMTGHPGIFAGGDMAGGERTVTVAIGHGKKAARAIDAWLRGEQYAPLPKHELATFERMNSWYYSDAPKTVRPVLDIIRRQSTFEEVLGGSTNTMRCSKRGVACPAAIASNATTATASVPTTLWMIWARASASRSTTTTARVAACAQRNARAVRSRWCRKTTDPCATGCRYRVAQRAKVAPKNAVRINATGAMTMKTLSSRAMNGWVLRDSRK